jgi:hypothetical protein
MAGRLVLSRAREAVRRKGKANGSYKHGLYTKKAKAERRLVSDLLRQSRKTIVSVREQ